MKTTFQILLFIAMLASTMVSCDSIQGWLGDKNDTNSAVSDTIKGTKLALLTSELEKNPGSAKLYHSRAIEYMNLQRWDDALKDMYNATLLDSLTTSYYFTIADIFIEKGEKEKMLLAVDKALSIEPNNPEIKVEAGRYSLYVKNYERSLAYLNEALKQDVHNADAYFLKGIIFKEQNNKEKAISSFQTCIEQDPSFNDAYVQLGMIYAKDKNDIALQYFDNAVKANPSSTDAMYQKAMYIQNKKEYKKAITIYKDIVGIDAKNEHVFYNIAYCYFQMDSIDKAHKNFSIAIDLNPQYALAYYNRGLCALARNDMTDAGYNFNQALRYDPELKAAQDALDDLKGKSSNKY